MTGMPDRERVLKGLEVCTEHSSPVEDCRKCPYQGEEYCTDAVMLDALALLREREDDTDWKAVAMTLAATLSEIRTDVCCDSRCGQGFHCVGHSELGFAPTRCWIEWAKGRKLWRPEVSDDD